MSRVPARSWWTLFAWIAIAAPVTLWLFAAQLAQPLDVANTALKAEGTVDAANRRLLGAVVSTENVVLLGYHVAGDLPLLPIDRQELASAIARVAAEPGVGACREVAAPDAGIVLFAVELQGSGGDAAAAAARVVDLARRESPQALKVLATGLPLHEARIAERVAGERTTIVPCISLCLFAAAYLLYRRIGLAVAALAPALLAIVWTGGFVAWLGHALDPISALLDPVLFTIGVATSVHFVECWRSGTAQGLDARAAAARAVRELRAPILLATATTMLGLWSMAGNAVPAVVDFGIRAALGIAVLHVLVCTLLPAVLGCMAPASALDSARADAGRWIGLLERHRRWLGPATLALTVFAALGLGQLRIDNDPLSMLPADEQCRVDHAALAARLGGVEQFHLLAPADSPAIDPARLLPFVADAQRQPGIAGPGGLPLRAEDGSLAVPLLLAPAGSAARERLFGTLERAAVACGLDGLVPAGALVQIARDSNRLVGGLGTSTAVVFVLLCLGMCWGLRSWRLGLAGSVPMALACVWVYGAIGWAGHPVSVATGMIGCTMLGLIVDNALHFLHRFRALRASGCGPLALAATLQQMARPIAMSSALLVLGFASAATSRLSTTVEFSLLACSAIAVACFGCLVVLPMLLRERRPPVGDARAL